MKILFFIMSRFRLNRSSRLALARLHKHVYDIGRSVLYTFMQIFSIKVRATRGQDTILLDKNRRQDIILLQTSEPFVRAPVRCT